MKLKFIFPTVLVFLFAASGYAAETNWLARPLSQGQGGEGTSAGTQVSGSGGYGDASRGAAEND